MTTIKFKYLLLLALIPSLSSCAQVGPGEVGIKSEFGKLKPDFYESGLNFYNPLTERFEVVNVQRQSIDSKDEANTLSDNPSTADQLSIKIRFNVIYQTPKANVLHLKQTVKGDPFDSIVAPRVNEAMRAIIAEYTSDQVTRSAQQIQNRVTAMANKLVGDDITIIDTPITHIELPPQLRNAIVQKQQMEVMAKQKEYQLKKEQIEAKITIVKGQAEAESMRVRAAAMKASPELVRMKLAEAEYKRAEAIADRWNGALPSTVLGGTSTLLNLK